MSTNKKFAIIATDNPLYKNAYINQLVKKCVSNISLIVELDFKHPKTNIKTHYERYFCLLGFSGISYSIFLKIRQLFQVLFSNLFKLQNGFNLKQIAKKNGIAYLKITNVNSMEFIDILKQNKVDYILNSGNQIYKEKILEVYKNKILNRHSALLPTYGGIYPIFWQLLNNEVLGGVTLHWIDRYIDKGTIAYQKEFRLNPSKSLFWHYKIAFEISLELSIQAINDIEKGIVKSFSMDHNYTYFSWPTKEEIRKFKRMKFKIV
jgi:methionyl-tRNA formyltransferase